MVDGPEEISGKPQKKHRALALWQRTRGPLSNATSVLKIKALNI